MKSPRLPASRLAALTLAVGLGAIARAEEPARVYGAASLTNAFTDTARLWVAKGHPAPVNVFGSSGALAKQVEARAPADIFASADQKWMDYLTDKKLVVPGSRANLVGNQLVLVVPRGKQFTAYMDRSFDLPGAFQGKLCTGETTTVPVGIYARQSLTALGWWDRLGGRIVGADDVRAALKFVESGACGAGIVYASDAVVSDKVTVIGTFPESTHTPIVYPIALVAGARPEAGAYLAFLKGPEAAAVLRHYGFSAPATATTPVVSTTVATTVALPAH